MATDDLKCPLVQDFIISFPCFFKKKKVAVLRQLEMAFLENLA